jgi:transcriptional regulator with XRE-family HTH domain
MRESFLELMNFLQPLPSAEHNPRPWIAMTSGFQLVNFSDMLVPSALNDKTPTPQSISGNCFELAPDYKQLKVELLQQILRKCSVSASEIDARLEQTPGTFEKWCKHELSISWPEFIRLNRAAGLEISFQVINGYADSDIADVVPFLNYLMSGVTQEEFCKRVDFSRAILNRWLAREVAPTVEQIFQILTLYRAYLFIFLKNNYAIEELNCLTKYREHMLKVHQACFDHPFGLQIISFMLSDAFERMSGSAVDRLARAFAMSPADAQDFLNIVLESKSVIEQSGKFSPYLIDLPIVFAPARPADTYNRVQQNLKFLQHVFQRYQGRDDLFKNHRVTHLVSQEQFEKAAAIQRVAYQKIWHVCYESKISSDNKDQRRIAMKVFLSLYDLGKILTCA